MALTGQPFPNRGGIADLGKSNIVVTKLPVALKLQTAITFFPHSQETAEPTCYWPFGPKF
jgi:hypothetical protein